MIRFCSLLVLLAAPAFADVTGVARVIDGDTFEVGSVTVRIHGIDAPEVDQMCDNAQGDLYPCGAFVKAEVDALYGGQIVTCLEVERDRYGRSVAKCYLKERDIGEDIVSRGWAEAYRRYTMDYDLVEKGAQVRGEGLWAGEMQSPAAFRADQRAAAPGATAPDANCFIKGNISGSGRIYHMPRNRDYDNTRINEANGERWFCSEAEAQAAGWRAARN